MVRKPNNGISYQALHKPVYTTTEHGLMLEMFHSETIWIAVAMKGKQKALISCEVIPQLICTFIFLKGKKAGFLVHYLPVWSAVRDLNSLNTSFLCQ